MKPIFSLSSLTCLLALASSCTSPTGSPTTSMLRMNQIVGGSPTYYYSNSANVVYVYSNTKKVYDGSGNLMSTETGVNDTVRTLGYSGSNTPEGDSLFGASITYRVPSSYATPSQIV